MKKQFNVATFAMGCFWQPDYIFSKVSGVIKTQVGYTGCDSSCINPSYEEVCSSRTGCAEAIQIEFNPGVISYEGLLDLFWQNHDSTQMNRQGPDVGTQYRSAIFYHNKQQKKLALESKKKWKLRLKDKSKKIVTEITKASAFYEAEKYHQKYLDKTGGACHISERFLNNP